MLPNVIVNKLSVWDVKFWQWFCWWFKHSGLLHCVIQSVGSFISKDHNANTKDDSIFDFHFSYCMPQSYLFKSTVLKNGSQDSSVGKVTRLQAGWFRLCLLAGIRYIYIFKMSGRISRIHPASYSINTAGSWRIKDQLDVTCYFISLLMCSTCFGH